MWFEKQGGFWLLATKENWVPFLTKSLLGTERFLFGMGSGLLFVWFLVCVSTAQSAYYRDWARGTVY